MVLTPEPGLVPEVGVASRLPENFLRPDLALGSRHVMNINCSPQVWGSISDREHVLLP